MSPAPPAPFTISFSPAQITLNSSPTLGADVHDTSAQRATSDILWPLALLQLVLLGGAALFFYRSVQLDSAEQFVWAVSMENGYWKHPPLPSWMLHALVQLFGPSVALPVVATQFAMLCALLILYRLGVRMMSPQRAMLIEVLASLISYFHFQAAFYHPYSHSMINTRGSKALEQAIYRQQYR